MGLFVLHARGGPGCLLPPASHGKSVLQSQAGVFRGRKRAGLQKGEGPGDLETEGGYSTEGEEAAMRSSRDPCTV